MRRSLGLATSLLLLTAWGCAAPDGADDSGGLPETDKATDVALPDGYLGLERAIAATDPRYQPALVEGGVALSPPSGLAALIDAEGANLNVGGAPLRFGVTSIGRGDEVVELTPSAPTVDGADAQRVLASGVTEWWRSSPSASSTA